MNKRRLLKLADLLNADASNRKGLKFDLDYVGTSAQSIEDTVAVPKDYKPGLDCGTAGCALGLAALSGAFKRPTQDCAGLYFKASDSGIELTVNGVPGFWFEEAGAQAFDIMRAESKFLFSPEYYDGPQKGAKGERRVAKRIRDFVAGTVKP
jgi:hypothetical protein